MIFAGLYVPAALAVGFPHLPEESERGGAEGRTPQHAAEETQDRELDDPPAQDGPDLASR
ncbi:MAG: hypothetical protein OJJ54_15815 [Pseudonocardia sp.]|nr:hypothetical protein [Pseudonocardia sp.]